MTTTPDLWRNPFIDNINTGGNQGEGVVAATNADQFFAAWIDFSLTPDDIIARKFDNVGNPLTGEVNLRPTGFIGDMADPAAVRLPLAGQPDGLAVAWIDVFDSVFVVELNAAGQKRTFGGDDFITINFGPPTGTAPHDNPS